VVKLSNYKNGGGKYCSTLCYKVAQRSKVNSEFFAAPSPEMAYVLGLFMSDGYLSKKQSGNLFLCIKVNDKDMLETISSLMKFEGSIYTAGLTQAGNQSYKIEIFDPKIISDVQKWGVVERKTSIAKFLKELPQQYWNNFIRGLFDGDGCVHLSKDKRRNSSYRKQCVFLGTQDILAQIPEYLGLENKTIKYKKISKLVYSKAVNLQKIYSAFYYSDSVPCSQRKKDKFKELLNAGKNEDVEVKPFMRNGKLVKGFSRNRCFHDYNGKRISQNRRKKEKDES
jgi:intein-encoded DNA endonuclease-like protein